MAVNDGTSLMDTVKQKVGPLPLGVWILVFAVIGGYLWHRHNQKNSASAAADQTNSNLGSASQLANSFETSGTMPYSGGDTYINTVGTGTIGGPAVPQTVNLVAGQDIGAFINQIRATINPNFTWSDFWALNPHIASSLKQDPKTHVWKATKPITVTISTPGLVDLPPVKGAPTK